MMMKKKNEGDYITEEDYYYLINTEQSLKYVIIIRLMAELGLRVSEVINLRWDDIDKVPSFLLGFSTKHTLHVRRKRGKEQDLPLPDELFNLLQQYKSYSSIIVTNNATTYLDKDDGNDNNDNDNDNNDNNRIFNITRKAVHKYLYHKNIKTVAGRRLHPHALRRFFGLRCLKQGMKINTISAIYGHSNIETTLRYLQLQRLEALQEFSQRLSSSSTSST